MNPRKRPVKHTVRTHRREGKTVKSYTRGSGKKQVKKIIGSDSWLRNISNKTYLYGDYDRDGTINIDDENPFDPGVTLQANDKEVGLGDELEKIEEARMPFIKIAEEVKKKLEPTHETITYRIKTRNSIINKLRRKKLPELQDIAGIRVLVNDDEDRVRVSKYIESKWSSQNIIAVDHHRDKDGFYTADHYTVLENGKPAEIQVVTHKVAALALQKHKEYKTGKK